MHSLPFDHPCRFHAGRIYAIESTDVNVNASSSTQSADHSEIPPYEPSGSDDWRALVQSLGALHINVRDHRRFFANLNASTLEGTLLWLEHPSRETPLDALTWLELTAPLSSALHRCATGQAHGLGGAGGSWWSADALGRPRTWPDRGRPSRTRPLSGGCGVEFALLSNLGREDTQAASLGRDLLLLALRAVRSQPASSAENATAPPPILPEVMFLDDLVARAPADAWLRLPRVVRLGVDPREVTRREPEDNGDVTGRLCIDSEQLVSRTNDTCDTFSDGGHRSEQPCVFPPLWGGAEDALDLFGRARKAYNVTLYDAYANEGAGVAPSASGSGAASTRPLTVTLVMGLGQGGELANPAPLLRALRTVAARHGAVVRPWSPSPEAPLASVLAIGAKSDVLVGRSGPTLAAALALRPGSAVIELLPHVLPARGAARRLGRLLRDAEARVHHVAVRAGLGGLSDDPTGKLRFPVPARLAPRDADAGGATPLDATESSSAGSASATEMPSAAPTNGTSFPLFPPGSKLDTPTEAFLNEADARYASWTGIECVKEKCQDAYARAALRVDVGRVAEAFEAVVADAARRRRAGETLLPPDVRPASGQQRHYPGTSLLDVGGRPALPPHAARAIEATELYQQEGYELLGQGTGLWWDRW